MMDGLMISINTTIITIVISFFIAVVIKLMAMALDRMPVKEEAAPVETVAESSDESEIAAVIAIAKSKQ
jgi:Na+-transporting methylmalonyl-CoA/oxaloacetate decarboxylase gamma subunit